MKKLLIIAFFAMFSLSVNAQELKFPGLDGSPIDLAFTKSDTGATLNIGWDTVSVSLPIAIK